MANFDKEMWKKHHFWILLVPVTLAVFVGTLGAWMSVPDETSKKWDASKKAADALAKVNAQPRAMTGELKKQLDELKTKRDEMCKAAWNEQKGLFVWPSGYTEEQRNDVKNLKFGEEVPDKGPNFTLRQFRDPPIYHREYEKLVESLAPMGFREDWKTVLRYIPHQWPRIANSEDAWLAMEDLWVQRDILQSIQRVNTDAAKFKKIPLLKDGKELPDDPKHRAFRSRIWEIELQLVDKGAEHHLVGKLKNISDRLQVTGIFNQMILKVGLGKDETNLFDCVVEGVSVAKGDSLEIKAVKTKNKEMNIVSDGRVADRGKIEIYSVEQVFDLRTVPVKRIEYLVLGKLSDRNTANGVTLRMAKFSEVESKKEGTTQGNAEKTKGPAGRLVGGNAGGNDAPTTSSLSQNGLERFRYVDATDQVRRLPFVVSVVTEQTYMRDLLESLANSKLRFQTTQVDVSKFHGTLNYEGSAPSALANNFASRPAGFGNDYGVPSNTREDQFSANLLELSIYGILSIFEKFGDEKRPAKTPDKGSTAPPPSIGLKKK